MKLDKWFGGGCGFVGITNQHGNDETFFYLNERNVLNKKLNITYPHNSLLDKYFVDKYRDYLDPLIAPLVEAFNNLEIKTISSCQGNKYQCPYIFFYGSLSDIDLINDILLKYYRKINEGWFWTYPAIISEGKRNNKNTWVINFYDTLEMLKITKEAFLVKTIEFNYPKFK